MTLHAATTGFEREASAYERGRPTYHPDLVQRIGESYGAGSLVELGAGTGIFTAQLVAKGLSVVAVEPVVAMRAALEAAVPEATVVDGTAECIPRSEASVDTIIAAQSFHWFDYGTALDEIARVLRAGGYMVTAWNVRDRRVEWVDEYTEIIDRYAGDTPRHRTMRWRRAIDADSRFEFVEEFAVDNPWPTSRQGIIDRALSTSFIAALDQPLQASILNELADLVEPLGDRFDYPYISEMQVWQRVS